MLDGVLHQLGDHHDQRGGTVGVEHTQAALTADPDRVVHSCDVVHHRQDPVDHLVEIDHLVDRRRQRLVHHGDGGHPSHRLGQGVAGLAVICPAGLQSQQCGDGLQVVLHPVMDLPDRRVLGQQRAIPPLDLRDIPNQHRRARRGATGHQRQGAQQHGRTARVDLQTHAGATGQRRANVGGEFLGLEGIGDQRPGDRDQVVALQLGVQAHAVICRQRVGAGVVHHAAHVEANETIADAGAGPRDGQIANIGKGALGQHLPQLLGTVEVGLLQP